MPEVEINGHIVQTIKIKKHDFHRVCLQFEIQTGLSGLLLFIYNLTGVSVVSLMDKWRMINDTNQLMKEANGTTA